MKISEDQWRSTLVFTHLSFDRESNLWCERRPGAQDLETFPMNLFKRKNFSTSGSPNPKNFRCHNVVPSLRFRSRTSELPFFSTLSTLPTPPAAFMWGQRRLGNCLPHLPESRCSEIGFQSLIFLCKAVKPCCAIYMKLHILILHISCSKTDQLEVSLSTLWA